MGLTKPTEIEPGYLALGALEAAVAGDAVYYSKGSLDASLGEIKSTYGLARLIRAAGYFFPLGELAEKPVKLDSKIGKLKTRNYMIQGKRTSTVELSLNGLSEKQKDYLESEAFSRAEITILLVKNELANTELLDVGEGGELNFMFSSPVVVFNRMRWTVDWSGEADGLWSVVLSTSLDGGTKDRIYTVRVPGVDIEEEE